MGVVRLALGVLLSVGIAACADPPPKTPVTAPVILKPPPPEPPQLGSGHDLQDWKSCMESRADPIDDPPWWDPCIPIGERVIDDFITRFEDEDVADWPMTCKVALTWTDYLPDREGIRERLEAGCERVRARMQLEAKREYALGLKRTEERLLREGEHLKSLPLVRDPNEATWHVQDGAWDGSPLVRLNLPVDSPDGVPALHHHWLSPGRRSCVAPDEPDPIENNYMSYKVGARSGSTVIFEVTPHLGGTLTLVFRKAKRRR